MIRVLTLQCADKYELEKELNGIAQTGSRIINVQIVDKSSRWEEEKTGYGEGYRVPVDIYQVIVEAPPDTPYRG